MNKIFTLVSIAAISFSSMSQESNTEAALKKVQAGLSLSSGFLLTNFETNTVQNRGIGGFVGLGFGANINFSKNIGLFTGLEFHFEGFGYEPNNTEFFYDFNDKEILLNKDDETTAEGTMRLSNRRQSTVAVNVPLMLLFKTNAIGYFKYFGKFGLRNSFLIRQRVNDNGFVGADVTASALDGMRAQNDMFFFRSAGGAAAGAEWNFAGNTSLAFEAGFYYGFTPLFWGNGKLDRNNSSLYQIDPDTSERIYRSFKANQSVFEVKATLLF